MPASEPMCLDGETIAAWSSGSLRPAEAAAVERHVADCARCRALMAAFVQTAPEEPPVESVWRRWRLSWVVPLATAATAAAIWIALPGNSPAPLSPTQDTNVAVIARDERGGAAPPASAPAAAPSAASEPFAPAVPEKKEKAENKAIRESPAEERAPAAAEAVTQPAEADTQRPALNASPRSLAIARQAVSPLEIVAPGGAVRWRIVNGQQVERTSSAATEWAPATIASSDALTAGVAPSASVCWIVGRRGTVYLTIDGVRFMRLPFPEMVDLIVVTATDDQNATVSTADGRSWRTTDQGRSWSPGR
jgi:hypothetical protein